jgi:hypothetical protein
LTATRTAQLLLRLKVDLRTTLENR